MPSSADKNDGIAGPVPVPDDGAVQAGSQLAFADNGDGTITDLNTGLVWEKKGDDGGLHDKDDVYRWSGDGSQETIWNWLDDLNSEGGTGFAGHSDWRLPNVKELVSILKYGSVNPNVGSEFNDACTSGCDNTVCSCTKLDVYWSSTSRSDSLAWYLGFIAGGVTTESKSLLSPVRTVRGPAQ